MKKLITIMMALIIGTTLLACGRGEEAMKIKVWGAAEEKALHEWAFPLFLEANPDINAELDFTTLGEDKVREQYIQDPDAAADVFMFPNDQIEDLLDVDALLQLPSAYVTKVTAANDSGSVNSAKSDGVMYAFPATADNGYFMYYDKSYFTAEDVKSLDAMLTKLEADNKRILFDLNQGWYTSGLLFTAGDLSYNADGTVNYTPKSDALLSSLGDALIKLGNSSALLAADEKDAPSGFSNGTLKAAVTGTWRGKAISDVLGDNFAAAKLPTIKLGTEDVQISSFAGYKLVGVNRYSNVPNEALKYADFVTGEAAQLKRLELRQSGPSNLAAQANDAVQNNVTLSALAAQNAHATPQGSIPNSSYWDPVTSFGAGIVSGDITAANVQAKLAELVSRINREE